MGQEAAYERTWPRLTHTYLSDTLTMRLHTGTLGAAIRSMSRSQDGLVPARAVVKLLLRE